MLFNDDDIKIASDKPSIDVNKNSNRGEEPIFDLQGTENAKKWGEAVAYEFIADDDKNRIGDECDYEMTLQRRLLLSFTATVGFEQYASDDSLSGIAQKSFIDTLNKHGDYMPETTQDTGAFSFYYLAFRRGGDTVRRIGQTFAMLCSHDGDPVYQELGEALYCWFLSVVKKKSQ